MALAHALLAFLLIACCGLATASSHIRDKHAPVRMSLQQHRRNDKEARQTLQTFNKNAARSHEADARFPDESLDFDIRHWWFGDFDIGDAKNLSLQIDTASSSLTINPGFYKPSSESKSLHHNGTLGYSTWLKNGCGLADLQFSTFVDRVGMLGLVAEHQAFGSLVDEPPEGFKKQFPHDGIAGMSSGSIYGHKTWFENVCDQNLVEECRFGLALGTGGTGQQIFGGIDESLFDSELTHTPYREGWQVNVVINGKDNT
jgi:pepsin A